MHDKGLAHRDVACKNLLLDQDRNVKVADMDFICKARTSVKDQLILSYTFCG
ncbi:unnamed protein product, partial [Larinioides sclopetarius]